jgi:FixJ family two-component response regulator
MRTSVSKLDVILANAGSDERDSLQEILDGTRWVVVDAAVSELENAIREAAVPIVFYNHDPSGCWQDAIRAFMKMRRDVCVILLSSEAEAPLSDDVVRCGGFDVLTRPLRRGQVLPMLLFAYTYCRGHGSYSPRSRRVSSRVSALAAPS